jgi:transposase
MRYVSLTSAQADRLQQLYKTSTNHRERQRSQALLLSNRNYSVLQIADLFEVDRDTVSRWMDQWEQTLKASADTPLSLQDKARSGRPTLLTDDQKKALLIGLKRACTAAAM